MNQRIIRLLPAFSFALIALLAWFAYRPGLSGGFLFDDFVNLDALGATGPVDDVETFLRYITSGSADPTGRPLALLSFLFDARDWPAEPEPFLRTNLFLHLGNGCVLAGLLLELGTVLGDSRQRSAWAATIGAGIWLLHPLLVSTTLYAVQREAMLPATFTFIALLLYVRGRKQFCQTDGHRGLPIIFVAITVGTTLATLSKANGVLLPVLALIIEISVMRRLSLTAREAQRRRLSGFLLVLPTIALLGFLLSQLISWDVQPAMRPWTVGQRVLTEPRVLFDYMALLAVPRSISTGLYNEGYLVSHSLWQPWTTLPALLGLVGSVVVAWRIRVGKPALSAALLFFFAGHLLESTVIPLEIYFEHRNYLPAALLGWPLARALVRSRLPAAAAGAAASAILIFLAATTYQRAAIWGNSARQAELWANQNPASSRAQATAAEADLGRGRPDLAVARLDRQWRLKPNDLQIALNYINARCAFGGVTADDANRLEAVLRRADIGTLLVRQWLERALDVAASGQCQGLTMHEFRSWLSAAQENPMINTPLAREKSFPALLGLLALHDRSPDLALSYFDRALAANFQPETAAGQASLLASHGYYRQALKHLDMYEHTGREVAPPRLGMPRVHAWILQRQRYWPRELTILRAKIEAEIDADATRGKSGD